MKIATAGDDMPNIEKRIDEIYAEYAQHLNVSNFQEGAAIYVRISLPDAQLLEEQLRQTLQHAVENRIDVSRPHIFHDFAAGQDVNRPGLQALMAVIYLGQVNALIVTSVSRLFRQAKGRACFQKHVLDRGMRLIQVNSASPQIDESKTAIIGRILALHAAG